MKKLKCFWLSLWCPKFWEFFPKEDKPSPWVATAIRTSTYGSWREVYREYYEKGMEDAYIEARALAMKLDSETTTTGDIFGIEWAIRRPFPDETSFDNIVLTK